MNVIVLGERGDGGGGEEKRGGGAGGGGGGELTARTRKGTDLTHYTCLLSIILSECWSSMGKVHWPAQYSCDPFEPSSIPLPSPLEAASNKSEIKTTTS